GVSGGVRQRPAVCATLNAGASAGQINNAIASCPQGQVVQLGAGIFTVAGGLMFDRDNVTLRGAGPDQNFLRFAGGNGCIGLWTDVCVKNSGLPNVDNPGTVANWTGGYAKGS